MAVKDRFHIRLACAEDAQQIAEIYRPFVEENAITFELEAPDESEMMRRIERVMNKHVWLVCTFGKEVAGYAYTSLYRDREAYQWAAESSIYVHSDYRKRGIGRILYHALIALATMQGYTKLYAIMTQPNPESQAFHESLGFESFAVYQDAGYKLGAWHHTEWFCLDLNPNRNPPQDLLPVSEITDTEVGKEILEMAEETLNTFYP